MNFFRRFWTNIMHPANKPLAVAGFVLTPLGIGTSMWVSLLGLVLLYFGVRGGRKKIYVKVIRGDSNTDYGPYKTLEEADEDTRDLECDKMGAFKAGSIKGTARVQPLPAKRWWD